MNFGEAKLTVSAMVIEDTRNMCGNLHPNSVNRVIFSGLITIDHSLAPRLALRFLKIGDLSKLHRIVSRKPLK